MHNEHIESAPSSIDRAKRAGRLQKLIDHLISLAPNANAPEQTEAEAIISSLELELKSPVEQLSELGELAVLSSQHPDEVIIREVINDTAELLLQEIASAKPRELNSLEGLDGIWSSLRAWDVARSEPTAKLSVTLLNNFRGEGQARLAAAYKKARDESLSFDEALDEINAAA